MGNALLDLALPRAALEAHLTNLKLLESVDASDISRISGAYISIACAHAEARDTEQAFEWLDKATAIHKSEALGNSSRTLVIRSMTCLRARDADAALTALQECWDLQSMTRDGIEKSKRPKHSGGIMLLARIYWAQDKKIESRRLVSHAATMRKEAFGETGGPRIGDSLFTLARTLEEAGDLALAAKSLTEVISMSEGKDMAAHVARALWFYANVQAKMGAEEDVVSVSRERAQSVRLMMDGKTEADTDESFMALVAWMLW